MKSGNLNFLEIYGPLQAFNGTALPAFLKLRYVLLFLKIGCSQMHIIMPSLGVRDWPYL